MTDSARIEARLISNAVKSMRPNVAHVVPALFGGDGVIGGAERYAYELARSMSHQVPTSLVTFGERDREEFDGALRIRVLGGPTYIRGQRANPVSPGLIREVFRADVVHCHQRRVFASTLAAALCRISRRRVFVSDLGGGGWDISGYVSTDRLYHGHLHISQYSRRVYGHGALDRARVVMGGVDVEKFSPDESVSCSGEAVFVGRLLPHKGVDVLVRAARDGLPIRVIGRPYDSEYLRTLHRLAEGRPVTFVHDADDESIVSAYRSALCVVLPSVYRSEYAGETRVPELLGQTLLEGMACGVPAICSDVASMPEVVEHGVSGFVVPANDSAALAESLAWLRDHPRDRCSMGRAARERVLTRFTWGAVVRRCLEAYADVSKIGAEGARCD